ncbi:MAG: homoserine kinase [Actinomycetota bacterium]|jgi:homoserine kinase
MVPATSANIGPGFDALGMAFSLYSVVGLEGPDAIPEGAAVAEPTHPAQVAFERAGGHGRVWVRNEIPMGRGLGYSGAVRIGGIAVAEAQRNGGAWDKAASGALALGTELEGHADNVAASLFGGVVATAGGRAVRVPMNLAAEFVVWVPPFTTSTNESRRRIGDSLPLADAVFNIGHTALLVAAIASGDTSVLREAVRDRIHQDVRFALAPACKDALEAGVAAGALCGWLSGSGPTVAFACAPGTGAAVAAALPDHADGPVSRKVVTVDLDGARTV